MPYEYDRERWRTSYEVSRSTGTTTKARSLVRFALSRFRSKTGLDWAAWDRLANLKTGGLPDLLAALAGYAGGADRGAWFGFGIGLLYEGGQRDAYEGLTLAEIGEVLGVTESRVCQIHTKSVMSLRNRLHEPS